MSLADQSCVAAGKDAKPAPQKQQAGWMKSLPDWKRIKDDGVAKLQRQYAFGKYKEALAFANAVGLEADRQDHHPSMTIEFEGVTVLWWSHKLGGLHQNDFIMAAKSDRLFAQTGDRRKSMPASPAVKPERRTPKAPDPVKEASEESFPASDPPAWTMGEEEAAAKKS